MKIEDLGNVRHEALLAISLFQTLERISNCTYQSQLEMHQTRRLPRLVKNATTAFLLTALVLGLSLPAYGFTPEDPEVKSMIEKGLKFLESQSEDKITASPYASTDGRPIVVAYAHLKYLHDHDSPVVKMGLKYAKMFVAAAKKNGGRINVPTSRAYDAGVYETAVAILFLAELDAAEYQEDLRMLGNALMNLQFSTGAFGYPGFETGDISQVQYVALAAWTLDHAGVDLSLDRLNRMLAWLMRVQDRNGNWPYQAVDPGVGRGPISQPKEEMSVTMGLAGGGTALITADIFRIWEYTNNTAKIEGLPKSLKPVDRSEIVAARRKKSPVKPEQVIKALGAMESYRRQNPYHREKNGDWYYYMLYTMERYESFFELATGKPSNPSWYDDEVTTLMGLQDPAGGFGIKDAAKSNPALSTAFAVLFLMRSSQKAIASVSRGSMKGGYGIPKNTADIQVKGSQIVSSPVADSVENLIGMLEDDGADNIDGKSIPDDLKLESDPKKRAAQLDRLTRLLRGSQSWQARRVAARLLGTSDELGVVPTLIYALSDGDNAVKTYALDGLNFISRKFESEIKIKDANPAEIRKMQQEWTKWYKTIDPAFVDTIEF